MCLCYSHTVHMGHECFLPTAAEDLKKSMTYSMGTDDSMVHNGCQHTQCALQLNMADEAVYIF